MKKFIETKPSGLVGAMVLFGCFMGASDPTEIGGVFDWKAQFWGAVILALAALVHYLESHRE